MTEQEEPLSGTVVLPSDPSGTATISTEEPTSTAAVTQQQQQQQPPAIIRPPMTSSPSKLRAALDAVKPVLEDYELSFKSVLGSIAQRTNMEQRSQILVDEPVDALPQMLLHPPSRREAVQTLLEEKDGAKWQPIKMIRNAKVHRLADIPYGKESPRQRLDIYFPQEEQDEDANSLLVEQGGHANTTSQQPPDYDDDDNDIHSEEEPSDPKRPVYIHIHGGGWSRGRKDSPFYGGPAICQNITADTGCIAVAIGYRLGHYPEFVHDAALAIRWVYDHIERLGGDLSNVFLSGHSAGAHIASLLTIRHRSFLELPFGIPRNFFRGLVLVSGVYDLFSPMKSNAIDFKNKWLFLYYVTPAFGTNAKLKREASPLLLLDPNKNTSLWGTAVENLKRNIEEKVAPIVPPKLVPDRVRTSLLSAKLRSSAIEEECAENEEKEDGDLLAREWTATSQLEDYQPPSTLILNATYDMGLQENGQLMAEALGEHTTVKYQIIEGSDHASICWYDTTADTVADFVRSRLTTTSRSGVEPPPVPPCHVTAITLGSMSLDDVHVPSSSSDPPRPARRGKRDKVPRKDPEEEHNEVS